MTAIFFFVRHNATIANKFFATLYTFFPLGMIIIYNLICTVNSRFKKDFHLQIHLHKTFLFGRLVFRFRYLFLKSNMTRFKTGKMKFFKSRFACTAKEQKHLKNSKHSMTFWPSKYVIYNQNWCLILESNFRLDDIHWRWNHFRGVVQLKYQSPQL